MGVVVILTLFCFGICAITLSNDKLSPDVKRIFSQLKLIISRTRNRMNEKTLDSLLRITIEGPDIDKFPVTQAVQLSAS